jgi:flagellar basal-body rod protein FlgB
MDSITASLNVHAQALAIRSKRNEVLASNIANAATPHFKARDIDFAQEIRKQIGDQGPLRTNDARHFHQAGQSGPAELRYRIPTEPTLDGNTVELAVEQVQFSENVLRYQISLGFLDRRISGLQSAIKGE